MAKGYETQKQAVASGHWPLYRFDPRLCNEGKNPLQLDSKAPTADFAEFAYGQNRYRTLKQSQPQVAAELMEQAKKDVARRFALLEKLSQLEC
jgi:pyruvate-ferredoxin/flavodoxin oxidoreductase